jgi:signal transduction histidine kinase
VVYDDTGEEVMQIDLRSSERLPEPVVSELELTGHLQDQVTETDTSYQIKAPLGDLGEIVLNVSKSRLAERVTRLRSQLLQQTFAVAGLTLVTLIGAFGFVWHVIQRNQRLESKRREAEEMAALGTLAAHLAHEIRNPLNSLNLNLELLEEDMGAGGEQAETSLASTRKEVGRLAQLVSDFLTYARPTQLQREVIWAEDLLEGVAEFLRAEAQERGVHLRVRSEGRRQVSGDTAQLRQVLMNLTLNAVQAVEELTPDRRVVDLGARADGQELSLVVRDRGDGIPEAELARVLEAFYTRRRGGTGLGLAIAERIVRAHGGRLELENLRTQGFEARVVLPAHDESGNMEPSRAGSSQEIARRTE